MYMRMSTPVILQPLDFLRSSGFLGAPDFNEDPKNDPEYRPKLDSADKLLKYWKSSQAELDKFWNYWRDEYLTSLRERTKVDHNHQRSQAHSFPKEDDVVLVHEEMVPRGSWKLGHKYLVPSAQCPVPSAHPKMYCSTVT